MSIPPFRSDFSGRLVSAAQAPKVLSVNSLNYQFDFYTVGVSTADVLFQIQYEGWTGLYCEFQIVNQSNFETIWTSHAVFVNHTDTGPSSKYLVENVSILQYS